MPASVHRRAFLTTLAAVAAGRSALAQPADPVGIVRGIFEAYRKNGNPRVPYSPAVQARMKRRPPEADPILDAQDTDVTEYTLRETSRGADRSVVDVRFVSFGRRIHAQFDFRLVDGKWVVANYRILSGTEGGPSDLRRSLGMPPLT
jgi:hypothetical protein